MKPEELLRAIEGIPEEYISEAKPQAKRREESRSKAKAAAAEAAPQAANGHSSRSEKPRSIRRKDSIMSSNTRQPVWQRVTTGIVAAAACTVFVGGGWFIVQQAKQAADPVAAGQHIRNILGGAGDITVYGDTMLMTDSSKIYLNTGAYQANLNGGALNRLTQTPNYKPYWEHHSWSEGQFYSMEDFCIYHTDDYGRIERPPFYEISEQDIAVMHKELGDDAMIDSFGVQDIGDGYYIVCFYARANDDDNMKSRGFGYLYQPETGKQTAVPADSVLGVYLSDSDYYYAMASKNGGLVRVNKKTGREEQYHLDSQPIYNYNGMLLSGGNLYYMTHGSTSEDFRYVKVDLETKQYTVISSDPAFKSFNGYNGKLYAVSDDGTKIFRCDPESALTDEILYDFGNAPETVRQITAEGNPANLPELNKPIRDILSVSREYILLYLIGDQYALINRQNGDVRYFSEQYTEYEPESATGPMKEATVDSGLEQTNVLGGRGDILPLDWDAHGETSLFRDDDYYYYTSSETGWIRWAIESEEAAQMREKAPVDYDHQLYSDGKSVYDEHLHIVTEGESALHFSLEPEAANIFSLTADQAEIVDYHITGIWHIRGGYFVTAETHDPVISDTNAAVTKWHLEFSEHGTFLKSTALQKSIEPIETLAPDSVFCDEDCEFMYCIRAAQIETLPALGSEDTDYVPPQENRHITAATIASGKTIYTTNQGELMASDEDGNSFNPEAGFLNCNSCPQLSPDGYLTFLPGSAAADGSDFMLCFMDMDSRETHTAIWGMDQPEDTQLCGFAEDPVNGGWAAVIKVPGDPIFYLVNTRMGSPLQDGEFLVRTLY